MLQLILEFGQVLNDGPALLALFLVALFARGPVEIINGTGLGPTVSSAAPIVRQGHSQ